ncbi:hypothetical protein SLEP1_g41402 [Rubroshorea leprosula]|nr:hypothetical protein SLEP1_g41402 [Rubroshorea leprosula]
MNGSNEQNMSPVINQPVAETEPTREQQSDGQRHIWSADSHSRRNTPQITAAEERRARKRKYDKVYREKFKDKQKRMKCDLDQLRSSFDELNQKFINQLENEQQMKSDLEKLEAENALLKSETESQSKELDELRNDFEELNQKFIKQLENEQQLKSNLEKLEAENALLRSEKESQSKELDELRNDSEELNQKFIKQLIKNHWADTSYLNKREKLVHYQQP